MAIAKRLILFFAVNIAIVLTISLVLNLLGVQPYLTAKGIDALSLLIFCFLWGMGGAFLSLQLSRWMAKFSMGVHLIDPNAGGHEGELVRMVYSLARAAGLRTMPEVGIYESPEINAFATGPSRNRSLVAVSRGLLARMNHDEVEGVLAHEISHVANGDMVTMTLIQGIVNAFVMFFARIAAFAISQALANRDDDRRSRSSPMLNYLLVMVFEVVFSLIGVMIVAAFSRWREYRADAGGAGLAGKNKMIGALRSLQRNLELSEANGDAGFSALKISSRRGGFFALFATHPPLEDRIRALGGTG